MNRISTKTTFLSIAVSCVVMCLILSGCTSGERVTQFGSFPFADADFEENIYADADYMAKERALRYISDEGTNVLISDEKYTDYGDGDDTLFFAKYFKSIIDGDAEKYRSYHTQRFLDDTSKAFDFRTSPDSIFTPQKLYNIEVQKIDSGKNGDTLYRYYIVRYLIHENNGTYRNDAMLDKSYVPLMITLATPGSKDVSTPLVDRVEFLSDIVISE